MKYIRFSFIVIVGLIVLFSQNSKVLKNLTKSRNPASVPKEVQDLYNRFVQNNYVDNTSTEFLSYENFVDNFNSKSNNSNPDWIDGFLESLPDSAKRHFTFVHRSFSIQSGTPMSPRVILFTPDAQTIMTFNSRLDENGRSNPETSGDQAIEVIQWNVEKLAWDFIELTHNGRQVIANINPSRCVMCHAGTPKPILPTHAEFYQGKLKPIFPQYPLWPGFYGSVNDIVGVPKTSDTIMANEADTRKHINEFLFDDSEELSRLRESLDKNPKYMDVVRHEMKVHQEYFNKFIESMPDRPRYKHLIPLSELYAKTNEPVPNFLKSAPYRRSFSKDYGHYILRPNFYLSSLMSFYQAQAIAREILAFPEFDQMKYSLLAAKFNCAGAYNLKSKNGKLKLTDLNPSFDLVYPNIINQASRDKQYLLAYQYNLVHASKTNTHHLPLFAWNLEGNEDIASYHYGNVFSDLNEIVLWNLAAELFPNINLEDGRSAHEARHAEFNAGKHLNRNVAETEIFVEALLGNLGYVSRFSAAQMTFATSRQKYYGMDIQGAKSYKGLPVSKHCQSDFISEAQKELDKLSNSSDPLPHVKYSLDPKLKDIPQVPNVPEFQPIALNGTRQACEGCHTTNIFQPQLNTDWHSNDFHLDIKEGPKPWFREPTWPEAGVKDKILKTLNAQETLPIPFGNLMPYGRRAMDPFSLTCESKLIENAFKSQTNLSTFDQKFNCLRRTKTINGVAQTNPNGEPILEVYPNTPDNIENCNCRSLYVRKHSVFKAYYHIE